MKRFIVTLFVLILIGVGGAGGLIMIGVMPNPFSPEGGGMFSDSGEAADAMKSNFVPPSSPLQLVEVSETVVPVIMNGRLVRRVSLSVRLRVNEPENKALVKDNLPHYQDIMVQELMPYFQIHFRNNGVVDIRDVKRLLVEQADRIYGELVTDVLIMNVFQQNMGRR
jgi:hypothetical protein